MSESKLIVRCAAFVMAWIAAGLWPTNASACVAPPPEPFCTKALTFALAGPPTLVLPGGGTFDVPAVVILKLMDFPEGTGICPAGPYSADIHLTATCDPMGADGSGSVMGLPISAGFNVLDVPVTVPPGPPRVCRFTATARVTLTDGMVLTESAESLGCVAEPAPGSPSMPRVGIEIEGLASEAIARIHPGDPITRSFRITNHDPSESFTGTLNVNGVGESRMPLASGPMPEGTAAVSMADPVAGDNFPFSIFESGSPLQGGADVCIPLGDPQEADILEKEIAIELQPGQSRLIDVVARPWGMCADGSCSHHDLLLGGTFSDLSVGRACTTFVSSADTSVPPAFGCDESGEVGKIPPPPNPNLGEIVISGRPFPTFEPRLRVAVAEAFLQEGGIPTLDPALRFAEQIDDELGRTQLQWPGEFQVDSFFDVFFNITVDPDLGGPSIATRVEDFSMIGAPTGFEGTAPFATALTRITDLSGGGQDAFADLTMQVSAVGIDNLMNRRRLTFTGVQFLKAPNGEGFSGILTGGTLENGLGTALIAVEVALDFRGFLSPESQAGFIFSDGFESGNTSRW